MPETSSLSSGLRNLIGLPSPQAVEAKNCLNEAENLYRRTNVSQLDGQIFVVFFTPFLRTTSTQDEELGLPVATRLAYPVARRVQ